MGLRDSAAIGRIAVDPSNSQTAVRGGRRAHRPLGPRSAASTARSTAARRWQLVLAPPNATTGAIDVAINPHEPADRLRGAVGPQAQQRRAHLRRRRLRPVPLQGRRRHVGAAAEHRRTRCRRTTRPQTGLKSGREPRPHRRRDRADRTRTASTSSSARPYGPDKGFYCSDDGGDTFHVGGPRLPGLRRLPVVVRARLGRPGGSEPPLQRRRERCARRPTAARPGRRSAAPHSDQHGDGLGSVDARRQPGHAERVFLGNDGGMYRSDASGVNGLEPWVQRPEQPAVEPVLPPRGLPAGPAAA